MPAHLRLFVAAVPPPEVLEDLAEHLAPRRDAAPHLRWSDPEQWHVTLAFLGSVAEHVADEVASALSRTAQRLDAAELALAGAGAFPDPSRAKVLWAGLRDPREELSRWAAAVRPACAHAGASPDGQPFRAHLTLARSGRPFEATRLLRALGPYEGPTWVADEVALVQSHLGQARGRRPRYEVLAALPVGGDAQRR